MSFSHQVMDSAWSNGMALPFYAQNLRHSGLGSIKVISLLGMVFIPASAPWVESGAGEHLVPTPASSDMVLSLS